MSFKLIRDTMKVVGCGARDKMGEGEMLIANPNNLLQLEDAELVELYHQFPEFKDLKEIKDRADAVIQLWDMLPRLAGPGKDRESRAAPRIAPEEPTRRRGSRRKVSVSETEREEPVASTKKKAAKGKKAATAKGPGRTSALAGKTIKVLHKGKDNPYREGTIRAKAFTKLKSGQTVAEYLKAGGDMFNLRIFMDQKKVALK